MKSKTLFFFAFIFLINTKILVYSEDYGYISLNFSNSLSQKNNSQDQMLQSIVPILNVIFPS